MATTATVKKALRAARRRASRLAATRRAVRVIEGSGRFDTTWYGMQLAPEPLPDDPIRHYVEVGEPAGLSPHPLFDTAWYAERIPAAARSVVGPFCHYLRIGAGRGHAPHPTFARDHYRAQFPDADRHRHGAFGHYLDVGWKEGVEPNPWFAASPRYADRHEDYDGTEPAYVHFLRWAAMRLAATPDHRDYPRTYARFDEEASQRLLDEVVEPWWHDRSRRRPLVSVLLPTRNRAELLPTAIRSVLGQTYEDWELLVVDDGSTDGTVELVEAFTDPRIRLIQQPSEGVCRARNHGLELARGDYVAYLDSDNAYEPRFLEVMIAALRSGGHAAGFSALRMVEDGRTVYRGATLDRRVLLQANYIDCNSVVHERDLAERIGGWDESLRRTNDWDYILRLSAATHLEYIPFVGLDYDQDLERPDRITVSESIGYRFRTRAKHLLDWRAAAEVEERRDLVSVVVSISYRPEMAYELLESLAATRPEHAFEVVIVDNGTNADEAIELLALEARYDDVRVVRYPFDLFDSLGPNLGIIESRGSVVVVMSPEVSVTPGWLEPLVEALDAGGVAAQPLVIDEHGIVVSAGYVAPERQLPYHLLAGFAETSPEARFSAPREALSGLCLAVRRSDLIEAEGFDGLFRVGLQDSDLCLRLREATGRDCRYVAESTVIRGRLRERSAKRQIGYDDQRFYEDRWYGRLRDEASQLAGLRLRAHSYQLLSRWHTFGMAVHVPLLERAADVERPLRWAIKIGPRDVHVRHTWGDWHFACALQKQLEALGHEVVIDLRDGWYRPTAHLDDVALCLRGVRRYVPNPNHVNLMWLISHPDMLDPVERADYDHIFVASPSYAEELQTTTTVPVEPLLQCTDPERFSPDGPTSGGHEVLFVGNSRLVLRDVVRDAIAADLPLAVYGSNWSELIPETYVQGEYLPNERLADAYRSAGVVLNDHWPDMRARGFISNRLFDLAACGATIVTDPVEGLHETFSGIVRTYTSVDELREQVAEARARRAEEEPARKELALEIGREHSFAARAKRLAEVATRLRTRRAGSPRQ